MTALKKKKTSNIYVTNEGFVISYILFYFNNLCYGYDNVDIIYEMKLFCNTTSEIKIKAKKHKQTK